MPTYNYNPKTKKTITCYFSIFVFALFMVILMGHGLNTLESLIYIPSTAFFVFTLFMIRTIKFTTDNEKIEIIPPIGEKTSLLWSEIETVEANYFFSPKAFAWLSLIPKHDSSKKKVFILFSAISVDFVKDVLAHLAPNTKIQLYPDLKKSIENK